MGKNWRFGKNGYRLTAIALGIGVAGLLLTGKKEAQKESGFLEAAKNAVGGEILSFWAPTLHFAGKNDGGVWRARGGLALFSFLEGEESAGVQAESGWTLDDIIRAEGRDEDRKEVAQADLETPDVSEGRLTVEADLAQKLLAENEQAGGTAGTGGGVAGDADGLDSSESGGAAGSGTGGGTAGADSAAGSGTGSGIAGADSAAGYSADSGTAGSDSAAGSGTGSGIAEDPNSTDSGIKGSSDSQGILTGQDWQIDPYMAEATGKKEVYQWAYYEKYESLVNEFYAVDASTAVDESQLNLEDLLKPDMSITKRTDDEPQILIYHTHSQEGFADSVEGDPSTTIMGVGEVLARILEEGYGYNVMHHLGQYDVENRDYAYNTALPSMEQLLAEYPTIEVVIDLHRDEMAEGTKLVTQIEGRPTARFMFFNGLSRTRKHGDIEYLPNENIASNLAFSFQMQALCNQYYPGLTRRIYLKGYRYNMHLKARYLLVEMGAQNNTYQECCNACIPLARMLDMELSGADLGYEAE